MNQKQEKLINDNTSKNNNVSSNLKSNKKSYVDNDDKGIVIPGDFSTTHIPAGMKIPRVESKIRKTK